MSEDEKNIGYHLRYQNHSFDEKIDCGKNGSYDTPLKMQCHGPSKIPHLENNIQSCLVSGVGGVLLQITNRRDSLHNLLACCMYGWMWKEQELPI